jgi:hypothetical protein
MTHKLKVLTGMAVTAAVVIAPMAVSAAADTKNTTINAVIASTISMTTSGTISFNIIPATGGVQSSAADTVTVATNNSTGYNLKLSSSDATNTMGNGTDTLASHAGTYATPTALANNTWGYRIAGQGGFGAGAAAESNVSGSSVLYAGVPVLASPTTVKTTAAANVADVTSVYYAAKIDNSKSSGTYSEVVTYTATTNP